jgi:hypothetical protein
VPTWEYASVITANDAETQRAGVSVKLPGGTLERQQGDTSTVLNRLGSEGWELVSYHSSGAGVSVKLPGGDSERQPDDTSTVLNRLGAEGWELVSYHSSGAGTWGFEQFWLKRSIS